METVISLQTERLLLCPWTPEDIDRAFELWGDPKVMALLGGPLTREKAVERIRQEIGLQEKFGVQYWKTLNRDTRELIGCCGLRPASSGAAGALELGFHILSREWGKGYALEAAQAVIRYAREDLGLPKLFAGHHPENLGSQALLRKLGFVRVGNCYYAPTGLEHPWYELALD